MSAPFEHKHDRDMAWRELGASNAFQHFFLGYLLDEKIESIEREIIQGHSIETIPSLRARRTELLELRRTASAEMLRAKNTP